MRLASTRSMVQAAWAASSPAGPGQCRRQIDVGGDRACWLDGLGRRRGGLRGCRGVSRPGGSGRGAVSSSSMMPDSGVAFWPRTRSRRVSRSCRLWPGSSRRPSARATLRVCSRRAIPAALVVSSGCRASCGQLTSRAGRGVAFVEEDPAASRCRARRAAAVPQGGFGRTRRCEAIDQRAPGPAVLRRLMTSARCEQGCKSFRLFDEIKRRLGQAAGGELDKHAFGAVAALSEQDGLVGRGRAVVVGQALFGPGSRGLGELPGARRTGGAEDAGRV